VILAQSIFADPAQSRIEGGRFANRRHGRVAGQFEIRQSWNCAARPLRLCDCISRTRRRSGSTSRRCERKRRRYGIE